MAIIEIQNLRKTFRSGDVDVHALRGVNLLVEKGEFLAVVGKSGSGKSTLFHILGGLTPPTSGVVKIDGQSLTDLDEAGRTKLRRNSVGFVFQKYNLLPTLTIRDNIDIARDISGKTAPWDAAFLEVVELLGIAEKLDRKPRQLSGGEQQRVAIARAIAKRPDVLLCDEPTGALDSVTGVLVLEAIDRVNRELGTTTVVITHNVVVAAMADRVITLADGRITSVRPNATRRPPRDLEW